VGEYQIGKDAPVYHPHHRQAGEQGASRAVKPLARQSWKRSLNPLIGKSPSQFRHRFFVEQFRQNHLQELQQESRITEFTCLIGP
jgi:hypothetical protein